MMPDYQKAGKLAASPRGTTVLVLVPSCVVKFYGLFIHLAFAEANHVAGTLFPDGDSAVI